MEFVHPALLGGVLLAAVPIILHLVMRQQPKHLVFPALRFIQARQQANRRQLRLRHLLLLVLRTAAVALLALAIARPSLKATGFIGDQAAPIAAALLFDTAPRMQYRHENLSRLDLARQLGRQLLARLPADSDVAVLDGSGEAVFQVDLGAARQRLDRLEITSVSLPLVEVCEAAAELLSQSDKRRKEIYVFSDLSRAAWPAEGRAALAEQLARLKDAGLYVVDVGVEQPSNAAVGQLRLSGEVLARNSPLSITTEVASLGLAGQRLLEAFVIDTAGEPQRRSGEPITLVPGQSQAVTFFLGGLEEGVHQGYVRLAGSDALAADDMRYFSVEVRRSWPVLLVAPAPAARQALFVAEALAPTDFRLEGRARFDCRVIGYAELADEPLERFAAVCLLDPPPLDERIWRRLSTYALGGGGVGLMLGGGAVPPEFNTAAAQELLPGRLDSQARFPDGDVHVQTAAGEHPLLSRLRPGGVVVPWDAFPVFRAWQWQSLAERSAVVVRLSNGHPLVLERHLERGRVLVVGTPLSEPPRLRDEQRWNLLPTGLEPWPFVMFTNELMLYLVGSTESRLNYPAGQPATLALQSDQRFPTYLVVPPDGQAYRQPGDAVAGTIVVTATHWAGNYRVRAGGAGGGFDRGFSVNLPAEATQLERIAPDQLEQVLGRGAFKMARTLAELEVGVHAGRVGRELFGLLIVVVALVMAAEHLLANRFYRSA